MKLASGVFELHMESDWGMLRWRTQTVWMTQPSLTGQTEPCQRWEPTHSLAPKQWRREPLPSPSPHPPPTPPSSPGWCLRFCSLVDAASVTDRPAAGTAHRHSRAGRHYPTQPSRVAWSWHLQSWAAPPPPSFHVILASVLQMIISCYHRSSSLRNQRGWK